MKAYPVRGDEVGAVGPQSLGADLVGGGEVPDAVADVDRGHQRLLALPHKVAQPHAARRPHQGQREAVHVACGKLGGILSFIIQFDSAGLGPGLG